MRKARNRLKILKVEDFVEPTLISMSEGLPGTAGELTSDSPSQAADRRRTEQHNDLLREREALNSEYFAYGTPRWRQLAVSARLDALEHEINSLRPRIAGAGNERVAKTDGAAALRDMLLGSSLKKRELPDPFEGLSNDFGLRTQPRMK